MIDHTIFEGIVIFLMALVGEESNIDDKVNNGNDVLLNLLLFLNL